MKKILTRKVARLVRLFEDAVFDFRNGVDTSGYITRAQLGLDASAQDYGASQERKIRAAIQALPIDPRQCTFIDLGSGKGRALVVARKFSFKQIVGVEISEQLCAVANRNTQKWSNVSILCADARSFTFPDGPCVVYLGNPFDANVMSVVVDNMKQRLERDPTPIYIIYLVPAQQHVLDKTAFLHRLPSPDYCPIYATQT